jgi:hypothetical protein
VAQSVRSIPSQFNIASFAADYSEARDKFLAAARLADGQTFRYDNSTKGPKGEFLSTDVAWVGPADASKVMVTISSTHGVEGYCGSGFQVDWLASIGASGLPKGTAALFVHAINPYGFAWTRRVTEEGNDLNRNYVDHSKPYPVNEGYLEIADDLVPADFSEAGRAAADARLAAYRRKVGDVEFFRAVSGGQYSHADGMFFGGGGPSWSNRTLHAIVDRYLKGREDVAVVDFHTGLGPYGYGEPITHYDIGTGGSRRVRNFWGESVTESKRGQTASQARDGLGHYGLNRVLQEPQTRLTMCTLEYGTFDRESGQKAFRADHWLHKYGDPLGKEAEPVRKAMRRQFYPETDDWKEAVLFRGHQVVRQAIAGLQRGPL